MANLFRLPLLTLIYLSVATVIAESAALTVMWTQGRLTQDRFLQILAVAYDVDLYSMRRELEAEAQPIKEAQVSYEEVVKTRSELTLDLDLREISSEKGLNDIRQLQNLLGQEKRQYDTVHDRFEQRLSELQLGAADLALQNVQHQLESVRAQLAKDQILRILDDPAIDPDSALQFVVTILKGMPLDKRKKILAGFVNQDSERLHEILRQIRLGVPDVDLVRQTRKQLEQFNTRP